MLEWCSVLCGRDGKEPENEKPITLTIKTQDLDNYHQQYCKNCWNYKNRCHCHSNKIRKDR